MNGRPSVTLTAAVEIERLDRDQRLVVIHAQRRVIAAPRLGVEHRVGGERAARVDAGGAQLGDRRRDDLDILAAERAGFAGMRVEPGDRDDRRGDAEIADAAPRASTRPAWTIAAADSCSIARRSAQMDRHRHDAQLRRRPASSPAPSPIAGELGEVFGVAGMAEAGAVERVLVDRVGDDRGGAAGPHIGDRGIDRAGSPAARRPDRAGPGRPRTAPPTGSTGSASAKIAGGLVADRRSARTGTSQPRRRASAASRSGSSIR